MPPEILTYRFFAKNYGWTRGQVDDAGLDVTTWFPLIEEAEAHAAEIRSKRDAKNR